jgi:hypothetical protein
MIDHIWRERLGLADWLIAPEPTRTLQFEATRVLEHARRLAITAAKSARRRLRGR